MRGLTAPVPDQLGAGKRIAQREQDVGKQGFQDRAGGSPAPYVFQHIRCGMWPMQLCGARVAEAHGNDSHDG